MSRARVERAERAVGVGSVRCPRCKGSGEQDDVHALLDALERYAIVGEPPLADDPPTVPCDVCGGLGHVAPVVLKRRRLASDETRAELAALLDELVHLVTP